MNCTRVKRERQRKRKRKNRSFLDDLSVYRKTKEDWIRFFQEDCHAIVSARNEQKTNVRSEFLLFCIVTSDMGYEQVLDPRVGRC